MTIKESSKFRAEKIALSYFLFAMLWILTSDHLLGLMVSDPALLVSLGTYKGILFVCTTALLLYVILRAQLTSIWQTNKTIEKGEENAKSTLWVFLGMALLVPLLSLSVVQIIAPQTTQSARAQVEMVAEMKADYLDQWFADRTHFMDMVMMDRMIAQWVQHWAEEDDSGQAKTELTAYINRLHASHQYDGLYLYHPGRDQALASGVVRHSSEELDQLIYAALISGDAFFAGIHPTQTGLTLSWVIPIFALDQYQYPSAVLVMSLDPKEHLFPLLSQWPGENYTSEVFLIQKDQKGTTLLSPLKFDNRALLSSVDDAFGNEQGYRGEDVIQSLSPLSENNWAVVAQIERDEVLSPVYMTAAWLALLSTATIICLIFALRLIWRQNKQLTQATYEIKAAEQDRLLLQFFEMPFVGMAITDPNTGKWLRFNPELMRLLGYSASELKEMTWQEVTHPDDLETDRHAFQRLLENRVDSYTLEKHFVRKNGQTFTALLNVGAVRYPDQSVQYAVATVQDISEQKHDHQRLMKQRDLYNTLSETNQAIIRSRNQDELFSEICRIAVVYGQLHYAAILLPDGLKHQVINSYGELPKELVYFKARSVIPEGIDPVLDSVVQSGRSRVLNRVTPQTSQAYFPVTIDESVAALLLLYADDPDFFSDDVVSTLKEMSEDIAFAMRFNDQEDQLRKAVQVVEASPVVLFRWENQPGWPVSYISSNVVRWGYQSQEFLSGSIDFKQIVHPDDRQWLEEEVTLYLSQKRDEYVQEYRILTKQQDVLWVEDITRVIYEADGKIRYIEGVVADVTSRKTVQQRIDFLARHDALTSLPNRMSVLTTVDERGNEQTALLMLDLDRFKDVNDSFGHHCGDQLLCRVSELLRKVSPADALLARFGGDEFGLLVDRKPDQLKEIALTLIDALQTPIHLPNGMVIRIGACVGIARLDEAEGNAEELLRQADAALYKAKEAGREQLCFYTDELTQAALVRINTEACLRDAIENQQLAVYFQPQIDIASGKLMGAEALLRWQDGDQFISPDEFIPVAEQSGLIHPIGEWVMDQVCQVGKAWLDKGYSPLRLAVNLSSFQLRHGDIVTMIKEKLDDYQYPAEYLEVELTESALMRREDEAEAILKQLQDIGVSLAIDDFGTGYSSLSYLRNFPLNVLKIDKSFIQEIDVNKEDREITAAIIAMGHTLGLRILAEGVETEQQLALLAGLQCDYYQGYLTSPAVSIKAFEQQFLKPDGLPTGIITNQVKL